MGKTGKAVGRRGGRQQEQRGGRQGRGESGVRWGRCTCSLSACRLSSSRRRACMSSRRCCSFSCSFRCSRSRRCCWGWEHVLSRLPWTLSPGTGCPACCWRLLGRGPLLDSANTSSHWGYWGTGRLPPAPASLPVPEPWGSRRRLLPPEGRLGCLLCPPLHQASQATAAKFPIARHPVPGPEHPSRPGVAWSGPQGQALATRGRQAPVQKRGAQGGRAGVARCVQTRGEAARGAFQPGSSWCPARPCEGNPAAHDVLSVRCQESVRPSGPG